MHPLVRAAFVAAATLACSHAAGAQSDPALRTPPPTNATSAASLVFAAPPAATVKDGFTYAVLGDIAQVVPVTQLGLKEFEQVMRPVREADFALANQEGTSFDLKSKAFAMNELGGLYASDTTVPADIRNMGVRMLTVANNHSADYGPEALLENLRLLHASGLAYAGAGPNLREARAATLLNTSKGRVAVVATAGTFKMNFAASDGRGALAPRAGISTVRTTVFQQVTQREMNLLEQLQAMRTPESPGVSDGASPHQLVVLDQAYQLGDRPGLAYRINRFDLLDIMQAVHVAKENSDFTIFTIHAHQSETGDDDVNPAPADYLVQLFHSVVDAGADVVAGHGNHLLRGIEIYKGKPIFYGLASFVFSGRPAGITAGQEPRLTGAPPSTGSPSDKSIRPLPGGEPPLTMWESIFAITTWKGGKLEEIRIYPIDLNAAGSKPKGVPAFAAPALTRKILEELRRDSAPFGTTVQIDGNIGVIRP